MEWMPNTLIDPTDDIEIVKRAENSQAIIFFKQSEVSNKRARDDEGYSAKAISDNKFKLIYNKRANMTTDEKEKAIKINDTDDQQVDKEDATVIVTEILTEIQKGQIAAQEQDSQMIEKKVHIEIPSSSKTTDERDSDIEQRYKQIKKKNEEIKREIYSQFLEEKPGNKDKLLTTFDYIIIK